jgi:hypothetical protein
MHINVCNLCGHPTREFLHSRQVFRILRQVRRQYIQKYISQQGTKELGNYVKIRHFDPKLTTTMF